MTPEGLVDRLSRRQDKSDFLRTTIAAENRLTPLEFDAVIDHFRSRQPFPYVRRWLDEVASMAGFADGPPQRYRRKILDGGIELFSDEMSPRAGKRLLVGFTGVAGRLLMPLACFLQYLPSRGFDIALLRDPSGRHYLNGIAGHSGSLFDLVQRLKDDLSPRHYASCCTYGVSMGGFAALRAGILLGSGRAIAVGGRLPWHVKRIRDRRPLPAFDLLCPCFHGSKTALFCVYAGANRSDRQNAAQISRSLEVNHVVVDVENHNVIVELWRSGRLRQFYDGILNYA